MKIKNILMDLLIAAIIGLILFVVFETKTFGSAGSAFKIPLAMSTPKPPALAYEYSLYRTGPFMVAKVFGRSQGCQDTEDDFIRFVSDASVDAGIDPRVIASTIAVESGCNQFAVSGKGAVGEMQIMVKIWKDKFDFAGDVNPFNKQDNIRTGAKILADLVSQYGMADGIRRYNGLGVGCDSCDAGYVEKILNLSGRKQ